MAAGATATLICTDAVTLPNALNLQGGTLNVQGQLTLAGAVTVSSSTSEIDPTASAKVTITGNLASTNFAVLQVGGAGLLVLNDAVGAPVTTVTDSTVLELGPNVSGDGQLSLKGGTLASDSANNQYAGNINLVTGTLQVSADNAFGKATLVVPDNATTVTIKASERSLKNAVNLLGGDVKVSGTLTLTGMITVAVPTQVAVTGGLTLDTQASVALSTGNDVPGLTLNAVTELSTIDVAGAVSGSGYFAVTGPGRVTLAGALTNAGTQTIINYTTRTIAVDVLGVVDFGSTFSGTGNIVVESGATLASSGIGDYSGTVYVDGGTVKANANNAFGSAATLRTDLIPVKTPFVSTLQAAAGISLSNSFDLLGMLTVNGSLTLKGPVDALGSIDPNANTLVSIAGTVSGVLLTLGERRNRRARGGAHGVSGRDRDGTGQPRPELYGERGHRREKRRPAHVPRRRRLHRHHRSGRRHHLGTRQ